MYFKQIVFVIFLGISCTFPKCLLAQENVKIQFLQENYYAQTGKTCLSLFRCINKNNSPIKIYPKFESNFGTQIIGLQKEEYTIKTSDTLIIPIRVFIPKTLGGDTKIKVTGIVYFGYLKDPIVSSATINIETIKYINAYLDNSKIYFKPEEFYKYAYLNLKNLGNARDTLNLDFQGETGLSHQVQSKKVILGNNADTVIKIKFIKEPSYQSDQIYRSFIYLKNNNGNILNSFILYFSELNNEKKYSNELNYNSQLNHIEYKENGLNTPYKFKTLLAYGAIPLSPENNLAYRFRGFYFKQNKDFQYRDSYLKFNRKNDYYMVGDMNENFEKNIFGRGIMVNKTIGTDNLKFLILRNNYQIFSENNKIRPTINSGALKYTIALNDKNSLGAGFVQQFDEVQSKNSSLGFGELRLNSQKNQEIILLGSMSTEKNYNDTLSFYKNGFAINAEYYGNFNKWLLRTKNYLSSGNYAGALRGVRQFNEQVSYSINRQNKIGFEIKYILNNPTLFFNGIQANNQSILLSDYEIQFEKRIKNITLNFRPTYSHQSIKELGPNPKNSFFNFETKELKIQNEVNYFFGGASSISIIVNVSRVIPNGKIENSYFSNQFNLRFMIRHFGLQSNYNYGPNYIFERLTAFRLNRLTNSYIISPFVNLKLFGSRLNFLFLGNYNYDGLFGYDRIGFTINTDIQLPNNFKLTSQYNHFTLKNFSRNEFQFGFEKDFGKMNLSKKELQLCFFKDENGNSIKDSGEDGLDGVLVSIDNLSFLSDSYGNIKYKKIPKNNYDISILDGNTYYALNGKETFSVFVNKKIKINIPMVKGNLLKGKIDAQKDRFTNFQELNLSGIRVTAIDSNKNSFYTLSNELGEFNLFLPVNKYTIEINQLALSSNFECLNSKQSIQIELNKNASIRFLIKEKRRNMAIKKFDKNGKEIISELDKGKLDTIYFNHLVIKGEGLLKLSRKYKIDIQEILKLNNLSTYNLREGENIKVYRAYNKEKDLEKYIVEKGEDINAISRKFELQVDEIKILNKLKSLKMYSGQEIKIFKREN